MKVAFSFRFIPRGVRCGVALFLVSYKEYMNCGYVSGLVVMP